MSFYESPLFLQNIFISLKLIKNTYILLMRLSLVHLLGGDLFNYLKRLRPEVCFDVDMLDFSFLYFPVRNHLPSTWSYFQTNRFLIQWILLKHCLKWTNIKHFRIALYSNYKCIIFHICLYFHIIENKS